MLIGKGFSDRFLTEDEAREIFRQGVEQANVSGKRVLLILPDSTRSGPIPLCFRTLADLMLGRVAKLDVLIALGTHIAMDEERLCRHLGITPEERAGRYREIGIYNHDYQSGLTVLGTIPADEIAELSGGMLKEELPVEINARVLDYDHIMICGPVFPHEIVGFSGGNKYFFPGISGPGVIDVSHWLGALLTNLWTIGRQDTPVRKMLDRAAALIDRAKSCFSMVVVGHHDLAGLFYGTPELAQAAAAEISERVNIRWMDHPFHTVISVMPDLYDDIWTASKGMYKLEPVVADGGTVIIYAPHIDEISYTHGAVLDRIGYHVRDYYLAQMEQYAGVSRGVMTHATLVKGSGTFRDGCERPRVNVVLATRIPRERCERVNLGYLDPDALELSEWVDRESEGILLVPRAGEMLHRLSSERASWLTTGG
jgi:nickel-dependent lactate racemase